MPPRARLSDVASHAGVSLATVDRVLNERGDVAAATARRVIEAARQLGVNRLLPTPYRSGLRFDVLTIRSDQPFFQRLGAAIRRAAATLDRSIIVQQTLLPEGDHAGFVRRIAEDAARLDGLIIFGYEHPALQAALTAAASARFPIVTLTSDLPGTPRLAFVGIDNVRAGRAAGCFLGKMARRDGGVLILCAQQIYQAHRERIEGCGIGLARHAPGLRVLEVLEGHDDDLRTEQLLVRALGRHPEVVGLYDTGGALAGLAAALRRAGRAADITVIGHELTPLSQRLLQAGLLDLVIDQNPELQAQRALAALLHHHGVLTEPPPGTPVPFSLHGVENATLVVG